MYAKSSHKTNRTDLYINANNFDLICNYHSFAIIILLSFIAMEIDMGCGANVKVLARNNRIKERSPYRGTR